MRATTVRGAGVVFHLGAVASVLKDNGIELLDSTLLLTPMLATPGVMTARSPTDDEQILLLRRQAPVGRNQRFYAGGRGRPGHPQIAVAAAAGVRRRRREGQ